MNTDIEEYWRPLKNVLRNTDLLTSLGVVRAYSVYREFGKSYPIPTDIEVHSSVYQDWRNLLSWELETLAREILIISSKQYGPTKDLRKWKDLASAMNKMKYIENKIAELYIGQKSIYNEVTVRLAHRQFRYQTDNPSNEAMVRYYRLYSDKAVATLIEDELGLSPFKIMKIGIGIWSNFLKNLGMYYPLERLELAGITQQDYDKFMSIFSLGIDELQDLMRTSPHRKLDDTFLYAFHELHTYPIIFMEMNGRPAHVCPQPTLLFWRVTTGIYYDMIGVKGFDQAFGKSFERYIGDVSQAMLKDKESFEVYGEEPDPKPNRCDWIIDDGESFLMVECKIKRLTLGAKTSLNTDTAMNEQIELLASAITQSYKALEAYKTNKYKNPNYTYDSNKSPYITVVTLEKWYLMGIRLREVKSKVIELLDAENLKGSILVSEAPFLVMSMTEYEQFLHVISTRSLKSVIEPSLDGDKYNGWQFAGYIENVYKKELVSYDYIFGDELELMFELNDTKC